MIICQVNEEIHCNIGLIPSYKQAKCGLTQRKSENFSSNGELKPKVLANGELG